MSTRSPEECDRLFGEYLNAGNLESLAGLYEPDATLAQQDGSIVTGSAAIREALGGFVAMQPRIRMNVVKVVEAGDIAVLYNDWSLSAKGPDGSPIQLNGKAIEVVRRQADGTWRFVVDDPFAR